MSDIKFAPTFPCLMIASFRDTDIEAGEASPIVSRLDNGRACLPLFSDSDLMERFVRGTDGLIRVKVIGIKSSEDLGAILGDCRQIADCIAFDPPAAIGPIRSVFDIDYAIQQLLAGEDL